MGWARLGVLAVLTGGALACDQPTSCDIGAWQQAIQHHVREYPKAEAADLYKFVHQGILGSEHAVRDTMAVHAWMQREVAGLPERPEPPGHVAPLVEPLPPSGTYVRIHLRPFLAAKSDVPSLLRAFVATANDPSGDTAQFACAQQALSAMSPAPTLRATIDLIASQRREGFGALHHSEAFEASYAPAYRVIARERLTMPGLRLAPY